MSKLAESTGIINANSKFEAFPYQTEAFLTLKDLDYCAIFHEQGLGKTKIAIDLILYWLEHRGIDTALIVTKKQLIQNWLEEINKHTYIKAAVLSNDKIANYYVFNSPIKIVVTNFETIHTEKKRMELFLKTRDVAIVIDESTKLKNPYANLTQDFFDLSNLFKIKCIMTGTPVANRPYDIWSQIYFLDQGKSLGTNFEEFKSHTDLTNNLANNTTARENFELATSQIFSKIKSFSVRETKKSASLDLPQKCYKNIKVDFEPIQRQMYYQIVEDLNIEVQKNEKAILDDDSQALKRLIRLNEVTSNPRLIDESYNEESGKERALSKVLNKIIERREKVIVWSSFIENINYFANKYRQYSPRKIHGSMTISDRNKSVEKFKKDPECKILFATPQAAKEGLTLTVANNVIFYDRGFNLDDYLQAQDRIHRISQEKTCYIYNLIVNDSIDEWIDKLLDAKQYAAFLAQGDIDVEHYHHFIDYSYGEIIKQILGWEKNCND